MPNSRILVCSGDGCTVVSVVSVWRLCVFVCFQRFHIFSTLSISLLILLLSFCVRDEYFFLICFPAAHTHTPPLFNAIRVSKSATLVKRHDSYLPCANVPCKKRQTESDAEAGVFVWLLKLPKTMCTCKFDYYQKRRNSVLLLASDSPHYMVNSAWFALTQSAKIDGDADVCMCVCARVHGFVCRNFIPFRKCGNGRKKYHKLSSRCHARSQILTCTHTLFRHPKVADCVHFRLNFDLCERVAIVNLPVWPPIFRMPSCLCVCACGSSFFICFSYDFKIRITCKRLDDTRPERNRRFSLTCRL